MNPTQIREAIEYLDACLRELHQDAEGNLRTLDTDEQTRFDEGLAERNRLAAELERHNEIGRLSRLPGHTEGTDDPLGEPNGIRQDRNVWDLDAVERDLRHEAPERGGTNLRSRACDAVERAHISDASKQHITHLLEAFDMEDDEEVGTGARRLAAHVIATSSPEYQRAWAKAFKSGMRYGSPDVRALSVLQRAMSLTDASGGFAVPLPVDPTLILNDDGTVSPMRNISTVRTIVTDKLRTVSSGAVTASYDAEASEVSDDASTFANIDIDVHMARAFIPHSIEIGMDYPGFTQDVRFLLADAKMQLEDSVFITGTGTGQPTGIIAALAGGTSEVAPNTAETFAVSDVYDLDEELPARFSDRATWVAHKSTYTAIREAGDTSLSEFWKDLSEGLRGKPMLGHPIEEASEMDPASGIDATQTADNHVLLLGDFRWYWIVDRIGFSIELIPHLFHTATNRPSGQRGVFAYWRNGADSVLDRAFRVLNVATTEP